MTGPPIKSVAAQKGHILRVNWASGSVTLLNMRPVFQSPRFAAAQGKSSRDIAEMLGVSVKSVNNRLNGVYEKLGLGGEGRNKRQALVRLINHLQ